MQPDEIVVLMTLVLMLGYGLSQAYTYRSLVLDWLPTRQPQSYQPADPAPRTARHSYTRRTVADRTNERAWIAAGLAAGLDPAWMADNLKGNTVYNRRKINGVMRQHQTGVA